MKKRIFYSICAIALASLFVLSGCVVLLVYQKTTNDGWKALQADATYISAGLETNGREYLNAMRGYPGRITLIDRDGTVLYDDRENPSVMENHAGRPEIRQAVEEGTGHAQRNSDTLGERTLYYAVHLEDGTVLRISMQTANIVAEVLRFIPWLVGTAVLLVVVASAVAKWQTNRVMQPINALNLDEPFEADAYEELAPLLRKIAAQQKQIKRQMAEMKRQQEEFSAITQNMDEGLVVTDHTGTVLTINQSALSILGIQTKPENAQPLLQLGRNLVLDEAAMQAAAGNRVEREIEIGGRQYRVVASPTKNQPGHQGAVLLLMDDTEKLQAEQSRREFSANVSHELKTPLTSISGYAEIMRNGLVKQQDIPGFAGKIYDESARLIALINDIIKISQLDEKNTPAKYEQVELLLLAQQTAENLAELAAENGVAISVTGESVTVEGVYSILLEILYNLIENGIRYNQAGGQVEVTVGQTADESFLQVADTGIGIPPRHQPHIFERFYRVDKSHSRESGGTGLGLSIVKRGALFHGGRVELKSVPGEGSTFTVWFLKKQHG